MKLICIDCGNYTYFDVEVETYKAIEPGPEGLLIENYIIDNYDYTDDSIRSNLCELIEYVLKQPDSCLQFDHYNHEYVNNYISCSICNSRKVVNPTSEWHPPEPYKTLVEEINENRKEYLMLRKEVNSENKLPVLWQHQEIFDSTMGTSHF